jgi:hypothetical protein
MRLCQAALYKKGRKMNGGRGTQWCLDLLVAGRAGSRSMQMKIQGNVSGDDSQTFNSSTSHNLKNIGKSHCNGMLGGILKMIEIN